MTLTNFADSVTDPATRAGLERRRDEIAMPPAAVARAIEFAIDQPPDVDVGEIVMRPTAQAWRIVENPVTRRSGAKCPVTSHA